jgi:hypothetical protein
MAQARISVGILSACRTRLPIQNAMAAADKNAGIDGSGMLIAKASTMTNPETPARASVSFAQDIEKERLPMSPEARELSHVAPRQSSTSAVSFPSSAKVASAVTVNAARADKLGTTVPRIARQVSTTDKTGCWGRFAFTEAAIVQLRAF